MQFPSSATGSNPMSWVRQRATSSYQALIMMPQQAFEILLNIPEPRRTLALSNRRHRFKSVRDSGPDVDGSEFRGSGDVGEACVCVGDGSRNQSRRLRGHRFRCTASWPAFCWLGARRLPYARDNDFVFPSTRLKGKKPLSASILVQKYLRPAAVKAGVIEEGLKVRFGFHNFRHSLASALVKMKVDPKTVQEFLRQAHITTTLQLYAQSDMESKRDAQGRFLEQLLGDKAQLLTERIQ
jgi:hypothetical protein